MRLRPIPMRIEGWFDRGLQWAAFEPNDESLWPPRSPVSKVEGQTAREQGRR